MENENKQPLVQVKDLCKYFQINRHATLKAVDHVSFHFPFYTSPFLAVAFFKSVTSAIIIIIPTI